VKEAILYFRRCVIERNVAGILSMYEGVFPKLTEKYYQKSEWPSPDQVKELIMAEAKEEDGLFVMLYTEIFYRHIHKHLLPTLAHRVFAWENYCDLFYLISQQVVEGKFELELPVQWVWDIVDEFLYQFEGWCAYTSKVSDMTDDEIIYLKENPTIWNTVTVMTYLDYLKKRSGIVPWLEAGGERGLVPEDAPAMTVEGEMSGSSSATYRMLGYFCIIGELRLHCLFRDYHLALKSIANIDLSDSGLFTNVLACHITLFQYLGISYFLTRRYTDAATTWVGVISILEKNTSKDKMAMRAKADKMYGLLAIALSLCPLQIDASVSATLQDMHGDKIVEMMRGVPASFPVFEELLKTSLPRNLSPAPPNYEDMRDQSQDATEEQLTMFLNEVKQHAPLPLIRSYLKLYSSVGIDKLAAFCRMETETFRTRLLALKHKSRMTVWKSGPAHSGEEQQCGDVEFYIKDNIIHVSEPLMSRREARDTGDFFLYHIDRLQTIINDAPKRTR